MTTDEHLEDEAFRRSHLGEQRARLISTVVVLAIGLPILLSFDWNAPNPSFRPDAWLYWLAAAVLGPAAFLGLNRAMVLSPPCPKCTQPVLRGSPKCPSCGHPLRGGRAPRIAKAGGGGRRPD